LVLLAGTELTRKQIVAPLVGLIAAGTMAACDQGAVRILPPATWKPRAADETEAAPPAGPQFRLAAPHERENLDDGVADAARQFAIQFVNPNLAFPDTAEFPESAIRFTRLVLLGQSTGGQIEHWLVDGAVDSKNGYGIRVRSHWRILLGRLDDSFFPVMAVLEGVQIFRMHGHVEMLATARRTALETREMQAAAQKADELAANRAAWKAIDEAKPLEEKAEAALKLAESLLAAGREEPARRRLQEIIDKFPETRAAAKAEELLAK